VVTCVALTATAAWAESLPEALAKAYQTNPQLNAERARQRATDENVPQALAGYRPQIIASLPPADRRACYRPTSSNPPI
jgi:outer membrane protein